MTSTVVTVDGEELEIPTCLIEDREIFSEVVSLETWNHVIKEEDRTDLEQLLPKIEAQSHEDVLKSLLSGANSRFGQCPVDNFWQKLHSGALSPEVQAAQAQLRQLKYHQYKLNQKSHYVHLLQEILVSRQQLLQSALFEGSLDKLPLPSLAPPTGRQKLSDGSPSLKAKANKKYRKILSDICSESGQMDGVSSDDEEDVPPKPTNQVAEVTKEQPISEEEYRRMLRKHRKRRMKSKVSLNLLMAEQERAQVEETKPEADEVHAPPGPISKKLAKLGQEVGGARREGGGTRSRRKLERVKEKGPQGLMISEEQVRAIYSAYEPIDAGVEKDEPLAPIVLEGPLPGDRYLSFFSVVKEAFEPLNDRKGELGKLMKNVRQILRTPECCVCSWYHDRSDWVDQVLGVVCYLAGEVGAVSSFSPLPHFVPLVEFKDRIDHWKWIGHGRDTELELMILCNHWFKLLDKTLPIVDYSDYEPPSPHVWTSYVFRRSTPHEVARFRQLERERYSCPHKAFIYHVHGFEAPVGPVKGSRVTKKDSGSRARGHVLLVPDRPNCVTILSLVRDAASRLPNGEGTRLDLCVLVQDSQFLADSVSETQLNNAVSGALDRLHYEKDPCVRYDAPRKVWIYLHRGRTEEDFERIYWACEVANKQRKMLMSRPKVKPKIIVKADGKEVVVEQGGIIPTPVEDVGKAVKKTGKSSIAGPTGPTALPVATHPKPVGGVVGGVLPTGGGGSMVMASVLPSTKKQVMAAAKSGKGVLQVTAPPQPYKSPSAQKPSRRRKPTPKVAEKLKQQEATEQKKSHGSGTPNLSAPPLQDSDFDSSDEDTLLPFLDSSLSEKERRASQDSTSSWQSSNSDTNDHPISIDLASVTHGRKAAHGAMATPTVPTPTFLAPISMEAEDVLGGTGLGEAEPGTTGVGGASQWLSPPSASSTSSSNNSAE